MDKKRIIFMGTPKIAYTALKELIKFYDVIFVVTQPDKKKNRKGEFIFSEVKKFCISHKIKYYQPEKLKLIEQEIQNAKPDLIITCAFGQIISEKILNIPTYKAINFHASLLPKLRGASPIQTSIIKGYKMTGLTLMYMDKLMDHGNIISQYKIKFDPLRQNYTNLYQKMEELIIQMINDKVLDKLFMRDVKSIPQNNNKATYCTKYSKENSYINFKWGGKRITYFVNGLYDNEFARIKIPQSRYEEFKVGRVEFIKQLKKDSKIKNGTIIEYSKKNLFFQLRDGILAIKEIQAPGKKMLDIHSFLLGNDPLGINIKKD